ncbi:hypothetical protein NOG12_03210 [Pseudidiomarina sp. GXY010]|uniref:Uncharacterized protein n=1 Tax=Pseudidiomarina fusca TaxID=2965078 RepID=A0ABU3KUD1_9GAMM|nr:hypothetical protein [Pseudidiomarina sp. GXY010]MDT7525104.1 hypothetical protein [Pseudidiomarina sp. GXY010]
MKQKTKKQQDALNKQRNKELRSVQLLDPGFSCQGIVGEFIGTYIQSEVFAKKLQTYYRTDTGKSGKEDLNLGTLKAAIKHFRFSVSEADISGLFKGGPGIRGSKSARQLRNGYLHALSVEDKKEIEEKANTFISKMKLLIGHELVAK